jgi:hypothetical protein
MEGQVRREASVLNKQKDKRRKERKILRRKEKK